MRTALRKGGWTLRAPVGSCGPSLCASRVSANYIRCATSRSQSGLGGHCGSARAFHAATVLEAAEPKAKKTKQQKKQESEERKKEKEKQKEKKKKELLAEQKLQQESANFESSNEDVLEDLNDPTRGYFFFLLFLLVSNFHSVFKTFFHFFFRSRRSLSRRKREREGRRLQRH
ncbi:hypothetical protein QOT17_009357 [Balamuthia mandrillaris]